MNTLSKTLIAVSSATIVAGYSMAANVSAGQATVPNHATVDAVERFVADNGRTALPPPTGTNNARVDNLTVYPTRDQQVMFVSFQTSESDRRIEHVALVETDGAKVTRFKDFSHKSPITMTRAAAMRHDAQGQARTFLVPVVPVISPRVEMRTVTASAQEQAADVMRNHTVTLHNSNSPRVASAKQAYGDSQSKVRALLTFAGGE
jgi:hypothetical protein